MLDYSLSKFHFRDKLTHALILEYLQILHLLNKKTPFVLFTLADARTRLLDLILIHHTYDLRRLSGNRMK